MSRMGGKRADGWYEMERQYRRNKVPQPPPVTRWETLLKEIHLREEEALMAIRMPNTLAAKLLKEELRRTRLHHRYFVPEKVLEAFGLLEEVERRADGDCKGGCPRKQKVPKAHLPLLERVNS